MSHKATFLLGLCVRTFYCAVNAHVTRLLLVVALTYVLAAPPVHAQATFTPLGLFGGIGSEATDVSSDGSVVVGIITTFNEGRNDFSAFRWTAGGTTIRPGGTEGSIPAVSPDGSVVVGSLLTTPSTVEAYRWPVAGNVERLGDFPGGLARSDAYDASTNASVVVGSGRRDMGIEAFRWTQQTGLAGIGDLQGGELNSVAFGVSVDGSVVAGYGTSSDNNREAFRWTMATGMLGLGRLPEAFASQATSVSADGSVIVGFNIFRIGNSVFREEAFRWTQAEGMVSLGDVPGASVDSMAFDVSADGSVIVGTGMSFRPDGQVSELASYWTAATGMLNLREVLIAGGATGLDGWHLGAARGVSQDGLTIVGTGFHQNRTQAWIATIPEPSTIVLATLTIAGMVIVVLVSRRRAGRAKLAHQ